MIYLNTNMVLFYIFVQTDQINGMTVLSFFSAKGGTGKTTFNMLFASFLQYKLGKQILVLDFDRPEYNFSYTRKREMAILDKECKDYNANSFYPVEEVEALNETEIIIIADMMKDVSGEVDYIIMDFPGSFSDSDAVCILAMKQAIDIIVIPVELDGMNIASSKALAQIFQECGQKTLLFFNRVHGKEKTELYDELRAWFNENDIAISSNMIKNSLSMKKEMGTTGYLRSTTCFPEKLIKEKNPGILNLFNEIVGYGEREMEQKSGLDD